MSGSKRVSEGGSGNAEDGVATVWSVIRLDIVRRVPSNGFFRQVVCSAVPSRPDQDEIHGLHELPGSDLERRPSRSDGACRRHASNPGLNEEIPVREEQQVQG